MPENRSALQASLPLFSPARSTISAANIVKKADRHQDAHLHKHRPDVPLGDGRDELPSHLHNTREQADYRTRYKQSAVEQVPRLHRGEAEKYDREQIDERHRGR